MKFRFWVLALPLCMVLADSNPSLSRAVWAAPTPSTSIQNGEIRLTGAISKWDVLSGVLEMEATEFATPKAAKALPVARKKLVKIGATTQFWEVLSGKKRLADDLGPGLVVNVVGREKAGQPLAARVVFWREETLVEPDPITPKALVKLLPPPQTQGDLTLRVVDAGFKPANKLPHGQNSSDTRPLFVFATTLADAGASDEERQSWAGLQAERMMRLTRVVAPDGTVLQLGSSGPAHRGEGVYRGRLLGFAGVRPEWSHLQVEWEVIDPRSTLAARGEFETEISVENVPAPTEWDKETTVNREITTPRGTRLTIESISKSKSSGASNKKGRFAMRYRIQSSPGVATSVSFVRIQDQNEKALEYNSWGSSGQTHMHVDDAPTDDAKTLTMTLKIGEKSAALRDPAVFKRFVQNVPVAATAKALGPLPVLENTVLARGEADGVSVELERNMDWSDGWSGMLWMKNRAANAPASQRWLLKEVKARGDDGGEFKAWLYESDYDKTLWRKSGEFAAPGQHSNPIVVPFNRAKPSRFDLEVKLEKAQVLEASTWFRGVKIPALGEKIEFAPGQYEGESGMLKSAFWFRDGEGLPGVGTWSREGMREGGLAIVAEIAPQYPEGQVTLPGLLAFDEAGREVGTRVFDMQGDARVAEKNPRLRTLFFMGAGAVKTLDVWVKSRETVRSGKEETVKLEGVAVK